METKKNYKIEYNLDKIVIIGRTYTIDRDNQMKSIKRTLETHSDTPLRQSKHAELLNKLQKYDLDKINENELEEVLPLVLKTVNKNKKIDEKIEEKNENYDCERCGHKNKKKINLTKHLKKSQQCRIWHEKAAIALKFCDKNECDFITRKNCDLEHHEKHLCNLNRAYHFKEEEINKMKHDDAGIPDNEHTYKQKIRYDATHHVWVCVRCKHQENFRDRNRIKNHVDLLHPSHGKSIEEKTKKK